MQRKCPAELPGFYLEWSFLCRYSATCIHEGRTSLNYINSTEKVFFNALHYTTLHFTTLHYTTLGYTTLHSDLEKVKKSQFSNLKNRKKLCLHCIYWICYTMIPIIGINEVISNTSGLISTSKINFFKEFPNSCSF